MTVGPDTLTALLKRKDVLPAGWESVFGMVAREDFVPARIWPDDTDALLDRDRDPEAWRRAVYSDRALVTQWDDGRHSGTEAGRLATSSASTPSTLAEMLYDLDAAPGMRVLEVGTGTGYSAGLLAARGCRVTSIEVDPHLARRARENLAAAGFGDLVEVITGDGTLGHRAGGPYDRIQVTAGVRRVPAAWIEQAAPGAVIVLPWGTDYGSGDCALRLVVGADRRGASGPFTLATAFMKLRAQRPDWRRYGGAALPDDWAAYARATTTTLGYDDVVGGPFDSVGFVLGLCVPDCLARTVLHGIFGATLWLYGADTGRGHSIAAADFGTDAPTIRQSGPRRLWHEVEASWHWWNARGRPTIHDFGLTVTVAGDGVVDQQPWYGATTFPLVPPAHDWPARGRG
ncbi:methyltransferase domain-containing protein [Embleya sp. NPDC055664]|uniref:methyltransferase domain-containing protein n=1 Tax=Embleya sp. NPDC059237 TaxID=3346784 RepID=UPI00367FB30E